jgi:iron complex outermembrane receptor protein
MHDDSAGNDISHMMMGKKRSSGRSFFLALMITMAMVGIPALSNQTFAQTAPGAAAKTNFNIRPQSLSQALVQFSNATGVQLFFNADLARGINSKGAQGSLTRTEALNRILSGSGLSYKFTNANTVSLQKLTDSSSAEVTVPGAIALETIDVQGANPNSTMTPMPAYVGGQVATGGRLGLLGNRNIFDTPFNTTSYTDKTIREQGATSIGDVLANDPSARVLSSQANGGETFYIRGFPVANSNVAFDGLYGIYPYWKGSVASAERVEVLKGPGALLFGMSPGGAVGGTVNIVPKRADDTPLTRVTGNYLSDSNFGGQVDVGRRFGANNEFGVRFNGVLRDGESYRDTSQRQGEATLGLDYKGDRVRLSADLGYLNLRYSGTEGAIFPGTNFIPEPPKPDKQISSHGHITTVRLGMG